MKALTFLMVLAPILLAQDSLLFEDNFNDGNADGWFEYASGVTYSVTTNLRYEMTYSGTQDVFGFSYRGDNGITMSEQDYSVVFKTIAHDPTSQVAVDIRYSEADWTSYALCLNFEFGSSYIVRWDSSSDWTRISDYFYYPDGYDYEISYWVRFECIGGLLRAKIWEGGSSAEPAEWDITTTDSTYINNGCMALEVSSTDPVTEFTAEFDNVVVTGFPVGFENTTWGAIKNAF